MWLQQILVLAFACVCVYAQAPVKVTLFYESLCSDSVSFVASQLKPAFDALGTSRMTVDFVPYGKATHTPSGVGFVFSNQHGHREYLGNKMQACAIEALASDPVATVNFVSCAMNSPNAAADTNRACFSPIPVTTRTSIGQCYRGVEGDRLLASHGDRTHALVPKMSLYPNMGFVPRVEINGVYNVMEERTANSDLKGLICSKLQGTPQQCSTLSARSVPQQYAWAPVYPQAPQSYPAYPNYPGVAYNNHYPGYPAYNPYHQTANSYPGYAQTPTGYLPAPGTNPTQYPQYPYASNPGYQGYPSPQPIPQPAPEPYRY